MSPGSRIKRSWLRLVPLFQKPLIIISDLFFFTLGLFLSATHRGWKESVRFPDPELYAKYFEKKSLKNKYFTSSLDPECGHQQPYSFFSVFADFQTLLDNPEKVKSVDLKHKN